nr:unnamed protein product [Callosobruchus analis]
MVGTIGFNGWMTALMPAAKKGQRSNWDCNQKGGRGYETEHIYFWEEEYRPHLSVQSPLNVKQILKWRRKFDTGVHQCSWVGNPKKEEGQFGAVVVQRMS